MTKIAELPAFDAADKALRSGASPRFDTISHVLGALGVKLVAAPKNGPQRPS